MQTVLAAKAEMLIRKPVSEVFEAFTNPDITTKFWFTKSSGKLEPGKTVQWEWEMYGVSVPVDVKEVSKDKRILIESPGYGGTTTMEWRFTSRADNTTFVSITESGFSGDDVVSPVIASTEALTLVLAGLKAFLEHNILLNLVADRFPDGLK